MITFNQAPYTGMEWKYMKEAIDKHKICGDGLFTSKCSEWIKEKTKAEKVLLTTSCTHALEMAALLLDIKKDDEIIMPSYTFVSTANAFVLRGAKIVFVDIRPDTMNINEKLIEKAITNKTKVIVPVHYAGVACEMDYIMDIAQKYGLAVVEDAAQGMMSEYKGKALGSIGDFGCFSFHETKNYSMGEGGALLISDSKYSENAEIIREKGTNRTQFFRGEIDKYSWVGCGSSYLPSEINAAYLWAQLEEAEKINKKRLTIWDIYKNGLTDLEKSERIKLPFVPNDCKHNGHMFYIKCKNLKERTNLIDFLKKYNILSVFHYIPLHESHAGKKYGTFIGKDVYTTQESEKLLRLPMYYQLEEKDVYFIIEKIHQFYQKIN